MNTCSYDVFDVIQCEYAAEDVTSKEAAEITGIFVGSIWRYLHEGRVYKKRYMYEDHYDEAELPKEWPTEWEKARRSVNPNVRKRLF